MAALNSSKVELNHINGIRNTSLELLEAAGYTDVESLASRNAEVLHEELNKANELLQIAPEEISHEEVVRWVTEAQALIEQESAQDEVFAAGEDSAVNYEQLPQVMAMLEAAPVALPLPARLLIENRLPVSQIPEGILLTHYHGDLDVRVSSQTPKPERPAAPAIQRSGSLPAAPAPGNDRISVLRSPRPETNKGRNPNSRWYIRGVLYSAPISIYIAAIATLLVMILVPLSIASAILLVLSSEMPSSFDWVPDWALAFPVTLPLVGTAYFLWAAGGKCRVCNQKLFIHRSHLKNNKAHRIPGLGYVLPLCLQILIFRWFRCTHCGTSIRLKE